MGRCKVKMVNGEEYIIQRRLESILQEITNDFGQVHSGLLRVDERVLVAANHIIEIKELS